jgi:methylenetetrahydrofolate--tRNA-(uracil-5-)-methyltransferase
MMDPITVIGGGLAGTEAAWQLARAGIPVMLFEMRPKRSTGAHITGDLAELVCSNSLGSTIRNRPSGLLKDELALLDSLLIDCAHKTSLPAGSALAVDRVAFASLVSESIQNHPNITVIREEVKKIPDGPAIIASGPLTSHSLAEEIQKFTGNQYLYFYDALSPIIEFSSINLEVAFKASRYKFEPEDVGDYINCPLNEHEYRTFYEELINAHTVPLPEFESVIPAGVQTSTSNFFEACLPIEALAKRQTAALTFGPMRPVGIHNPHKSEKPFAVVQLRQENAAASLYNLVGFQTNLTFPEQERVFRIVPGLERAEFTRFGQMHRNTYINSPALLLPTLQTIKRKDLFFCGQIVGVEGYVGNIASGLLAGLNAARMINGQDLIIFPNETMIGALHHYITHASAVGFQPMKSNFGLLPPLEKIPQSKQERGYCYAKRALSSLSTFIEENALI